MPAYKTETEAAVDAAIRLTVWKNIRRYLLLTGIGFVILDLVITLTVVILLAIDTRHADKQHAQVACHNTATLARIQRTTVQQQAAQTNELVKKGFTFGLPKAQFDKLLKQSAKQQHDFLTALDKLTKANCTTLE